MLIKFGEWSSHVALIKHIVFNVKVYSEKHVLVLLS